MYSHNYLDDTSTVRRRSGHLRLTWYLLTTFRWHHNFKVWQIFSTTRPGIRPMLTMPADRPIRWCIINLYRYLYHQTVCHRNIQGMSPKCLSQKWFILCIIILFIMTYESIFSLHACLVNICNSLPNSVTDARTINAFKARVDKLSQHLQ